MKKLSVAIPQYSLGKILWVWTAAAIPMGILGWIVAPAFARGSNDPVFARLAVLTVGLVWQFALVMLLLRHETGTWRWSMLGPRLWLNAPRSPRTGETRARLWWWLVPITLLTAVFELRAKGVLDDWWVHLFPFLAEPPGWSLGAALATPEARSHLVGAWGTGGLFLVNALFNTVLGEELLFRGLLLPRMAGAFAEADWVANGFLFGVYHLHQPWGILGSVTHGILMFALPSRYFRSAWFGIVAHSGQSIFFAVLMLLLILGLA
jgi:membrane protease YdiL (CAAX protease family)